MASLSTERKSLEEQTTQLKKEKANLEGQLSVQSQVGEGVKLMSPEMSRKALYYLKLATHKIERKSLALTGNLLRSLFSVFTSFFDLHFLFHFLIRSSLPISLLFSILTSYFISFFDLHFLFHFFFRSSFPFSILTSFFYNLNFLFQSSLHFFTSFFNLHFLFQSSHLLSILTFFSILSSFFLIFTSFFGSSLTSFFDLHFVF